MFEIYFTAQVCCQLPLCAKQNKFCCSHVEAWMDDYTSNGEGLHRVQQLPYNFTLHRVVHYMNKTIKITQV